MEKSYNIRTITEQEIAAWDENGSWVKLRFQEASGSVTILSDYGHWSFFWMPAHRSQKLPDFLAGLLADYAGGKFLGESLHVYDREETARGIKDYILECRRDDSMTRQEARGHWEEIGLLEDGFDAWCLETTIADAWEMHRTIMNPDWRNFWDRLWVPFLVPALRELSS